MNIRPSNYRSDGATVWNRAMHRRLFKEKKYHFSTVLFVLTALFGTNANSHTKLYITNIN